MAKFVSGRQPKLKLGVKSYTENSTVLEVTGNIGIGTTNATSDLYIVGDQKVTGIITAGSISVTTANFSGNIDVDGHTELDNLNVSGVSTFGGAADFNGSVDIDGHTELDNVNVSGFSTFTNAADFNGDIDVDGHTELDDVNISGVATATAIHLGAEGSAIRVTSNTISGPAILTLDPAGVGDNTGKVVIAGDLQVDGTQTVVNSTTMSVDDKNLELGTGAANDAAADGGGITVVSGEGNKTFQFEATGDNLGSSENLNIASGKDYKVNNESVLNSTTLGTNVVNSSLTNLGTLTELDVNGHTELDNLNVSGFSTFTNAADFNGDIDVDGHTDLDNLNVSGFSTFVGFSTFNSSVFIAGISSVGAAITMYPSTGIVSATTFHGDLVGTALTTTNIPDLEGDVSSVNKVTTLATVNSNTGTFGSSTAIPAITVNAKGLITAATTNAITVGDGQLNLAVSGNGLSGSATFTANQATGSDSTFTVTSNATDANTASAIVARDGSGNFSAGTISAALSGNATSATTLETARNIGGVSFNGSANINLPGVNEAGNQNTSGNAATATTLETARNIGGVSFDGSGNINLPGVNEAGNQNTSGNAATATEATNVTVTANNSANETVYPVFVDGATGTQGAETDTGLNYNPGTGTLSAANITLSGNLTVDGTTTTINSATLTVDDKNIELGSVASPTDSTADGGGITLKGATDHTINWVNSTDAWTFSEHIDLASGKAYYINGTSVLTNNTLGSGVINSSLTSLGTITAGVWNGTAIDDAYIDTIDNANKVSIGSIDIDGGTDIGADLADGDEFIVDDGGGGTNRRSDVDRIYKYVFGKVSGDVTIESNGTASIGSGVIVNDDIKSDAAIANSKLAHSSVSFGGVSVDLGSSDATPAFDLTDATNYPTSSLSGTITNTQLAGSIADSKLNQITTANKIDIGSIDLDGATEMNAALADVDLFLVDDGGNGTEKSMLASRLPTYLFGKVSGDVTIESDGTASIGSGVIVDADISGSAAIANSKLANDSVSYGGVSLDLGQSDATPAFDLTDATNYPTSSLSGTITNTQLAGSIENAKLTNSTISGVSLGSNLENLTPGDFITGSAYNGGTARTFAVDATDANTASKVVARDGSGNFSAETITAALSGTATEATNFTVTANNSTNETVYPVFVDGATGTQGAETDTGLNYNPSSGTLSAANITLSGDLTVNGTTTTINSATLTVDDKNIELGSVSSPTDVTADGGGITLKGTTDHTINWVNSTDAWTFSEHINLANTKGYQLNGTTVLSGTTLGSTIVTSSLTSLGTITTGVWNGTAIDDTYIGTIDNANKVALSSIDLDGGTDIGADLVDADLFIVDDGAGGTNRKSTLSRIPTYVFDKVSSDISIASDGTASIGSGVIVNADISGSAAIADTKLDTISTSGKVSNSATTATNANTASAIVARDGSGNFSAETITAALSGNATSATTATNATHVTVTDNENTNEENLITFVENATTSTGNVGLEMDGHLTYNPSTGTLSAIKFSGNGSDISGISAQVAVTDETSDTTCFPLFATSATGTQNLKSAASKLIYNSSSGELASTVFKGKGAAEDASGNTVRVTISNSAPSSPATGDIWIDIS